MSEAVKNHGQMPVDKGRHEATAPISEVFQKCLESWKSEGRPHSEQTERDAHAGMQLQIDTEENLEIKQFMQDEMEHYCQDGSMLLSYIYKVHWHQSIKKQRNLQRKFQPVKKLFIVLESILADQCDSSEYIKMYGQRRYPLTIPDNHTGKERKKLRNVDMNEPLAGLLESYYKFGSHKFQVGHAIKDILDLLKKRYGLDFKELERSYQRTGEDKS